MCNTMQLQYDVYQTQVMDAAEDTTAVRLPADPPAHGRQKEWMVNYVFVRTLSAARNHCPYQIYPS